jgi:hypothetical protein
LRRLPLRHRAATLDEREWQGEAQVTTHENALQELMNSYNNSPQPSFKVTNYFEVYATLFSHLRGTPCTFIETGILNGGSLFMWRSWLGKQARIIGVDLNPGAEKWKEHGFEIHVGDQGDPQFWRDTFKKIGQFDVLLDDGGHQSFQQIVTLSEALKAAKERSTILIEDTCSSIMKEFSRHRDHSFLQYAKDSTDNLVANTTHFFPGQFPAIDNPEIVDLFGSVHSIEFFSGMVVYKIDRSATKRPELVWNRQPAASASDFRYNGTVSAVVDWPNPFTRETVVVHGGRD